MPPSKGDWKIMPVVTYPQVVEHQVQTWVIAPPEHQGWDAAAQLKKIWPEREPICRLTPDEFNQGLDRVLTKHCQGQRTLDNA